VKPLPATRLLVGHDRIPACSRSVSRYHSLRSTVARRAMSLPDRCWLSRSCCRLSSAQARGPLSRWPVVRGLPGLGLPQTSPRRRQQQAGGGAAVQPGVTTSQPLPSPRTGNAFRRTDMGSWPSKEMISSATKFGGTSLRTALGWGGSSFEYRSPSDGDWRHRTWADSRWQLPLLMDLASTLRRGRYWPG
jgi:hypothetical protein